MAGFRTWPSTGWPAQGVYHYGDATIACPNDEFFTVHDTRDMRGPFHFSSHDEVRDGLERFFTAVRKDQKRREEMMFEDPQKDLVIISPFAGGAVSVHIVNATKTVDGRLVTERIYCENRDHVSLIVTAVNKMLAAAESESS
jgi:hypothetical protein